MDSARRQKPQAALMTLALCVTFAALLAGCETSAGSGEKVRLVITPVATPTATRPAPPTVGPANYTVSSGDTLSSIASRFGISVDDIVRANNIADANSLAEGQVLTIPAHSAATPATQEGTPTAMASPALPPPDITPPQGPTAEP